MERKSVIKKLEVAAITNIIYEVNTVANTILIIDDDEHLRLILQEIFEDAGYEVRVAVNGRDGVASFKRNTPDIVITDIFMPEKDGIETITELLRDFPDTKIIAMTGVHSLPMDSLKIANILGAARCIKKPFDPDELIAMVEGLLNETRPDALP